MPIWQLDHRNIFPDPFDADPDGLLAIGGDLSSDRLLLAYRSGIFPWFTLGHEPYWFAPDPRCILDFPNLHVSGSMKQLLKRKAFDVTLDKDFESVIKSCAQIKRKNDESTWIDDYFIDAYCKLHHQGHAHSVEVWQNEKLVGGLYGIIQGGVFFGESMFSRVSNASKYGFISLVAHLQKHQFDFIDCQIYNDHLASLGAHNISREEYMLRLHNGLYKNATPVVPETL